MKLFGITSTAMLALLLGIAAPVYAQHEQDGKQEHSQQKQSKHEQAKPEAGRAQPQRQSAQKQQHAQPKGENKPQQHAQRQPQSNQSRQQGYARQQGNGQPPHRSQAQQRVRQSAWRQRSSQHWNSDHRTWQQRGGYHGYRIPDDRFRGYFGPGHGFRIFGLPFLVVGGYPRFQYEGYWISTLDPWPQSWGNDWYDNDDVYVNYVDNGYYLYNRRYPDVGIAISISM